MRVHCHYTGEYRGAAPRICNLKYSVPKKIPIVFHNGSNYEHHFIMKKLTKEFKKQFTCLEESTQKNITFTVSIEKKLQELIKKGIEITKKHILHFTVY